MLDLLVQLSAALGIRADLAIAAAFGAAFLVLNRKLTPRQAMASVAGGIGAANYLTVLTARALHNWFPWLPADVLLERAVAMLWGLGGGFLLAGVIVLLERWKNDPLRTIKEIKS